VEMTSLAKIQKGYLRSPELSNFVLYKNAENGVEQPLASVYILYLYKSYVLHILD